MTQRAIRVALTKFLNLTDAPNKTLLIEALEPGSCFGFAICRAAMRHLGKLRWWKAALAAVTNWDGSLQQLEEIIVLPDSESPHPTLKEIMNRVLNYIVSTQASPKLKQIIPNLNTRQSELLLPNLKNLILVKGKEVIEPKYHEKIAGYFSNEKLDDLLDEEDVIDSIFLVSGARHTINIDYENNTWIVYDPNYDHLSPQTMEKKFLWKHQAIAEIKRILGDSLDLRFAKFETKDSYKSAFVTFRENLTSDDAVNLISRNGLITIIEETPNDLSFILSLAEKSIQFEECMARALLIKKPDTQHGLHTLLSQPEMVAMILQKAEASVKIRASFFQALDVVYFDNHILGVIIRSQPILLISILRLVRLATLIQKELFVASLSKTSLSRFTNLQLAMAFAPAVFPDLLNFLDESIGKFNILAMIFDNINGKRKTFHMMIKNVPSQIIKLLQWIEIFPVYADSLFYALLDTYNNSTYLDILISSQPNLMEYLIKLSRANTNCTKIFIRAICNGNKGKGNFSNALHFLANYDAAGFSIGKLFENYCNRETIDDLAKLFTQRDGKGRCVLHFIAYGFGYVLPKIAADAETSVSAVDHLAQSLVIRSVNGWTPLHFLARYNEELIPRVLQLAARSAYFLLILPDILQLAIRKRFLYPNLFKIILKTAEASHLTACEILAAIPPKSSSQKKRVVNLIKALITRANTVDEVKLILMHLEKYSDSHYKYLFETTFPKPLLFRPTWNHHPVSATWISIIEVSRRRFQSLSGETETWDFFNKVTYEAKLFPNSQTSRHRQTTFKFYSQVPHASPLVTDRTERQVYCDSPRFCK